jgi:hypothetical protein
MWGIRSLVSDFEDKTDTLQFLTIQILFLKPEILKGQQLLMDEKENY